MIALPIIFHFKQTQNSSKQPLFQNPTQSKQSNIKSLHLIIIIFFWDDLIYQNYQTQLSQQNYCMRSFARYQQTPLIQSSYDIKHKQLNNSRTSFLNTNTKNPEMDLLKLPALNSMRRSVSISSTQRNAKFKLQNLEDKLEQLGADVHNTRLEAQETLNHISFLKQSLAVNEVGRVRQDLKKQIRGLERLIKGTELADEERNQLLKNDCKELWNKTEELRQTLFDLRMRTERLDQNMGFLNRRQE